MMNQKILKPENNWIGWSKENSLKSNLKWAWQRVIRGWDGRAMYSTDYYISQLMLELLPGYKKFGGTPGYFLYEKEVEISHEVANEKWCAVLDIMILGFEAAIKLTDMYNPNNEEWKEISAEYGEVMDVGLGAFKKHFSSLWT